MEPIIEACHAIHNVPHFENKRHEIKWIWKEKFEHAIAIDADYAAAYAGLADAYSYLYMFWAATEDNRTSAEEASHRAIQLDFDLAEAHVARGIAVSLSKRYEEAGREFETAIRLNPGLFEAYYFYARTHYSRGLLEDAVYWFRRASEVRPEDYQAPTLLASALGGLGRKEESDDAFRLVLDLAKAHLRLYPGDARALYFSALALAQLGDRQEESLEFAERALDRLPTPTARAFLRMRVQQAGSLADIVADLNRHLTSDTQQTDRFMTLILMGIDPAAGSLAWVRAGHDPALFYDPHQDRFEELRGPGLALGLKAAVAYSAIGKSSLQPGQIIALGTDGIWEARNTSGEMFGKRRLKRLLRQNAEAETALLVNQLFQHLQDFTRGTLPEDDRTMVIAKIKETGSE